MRKTVFFLLMAVFAIYVCQATKREHRATWMSGYIYDWPTKPLTTENVEEQKNICIADLDSLRRTNFTTVYYHVRTMCDAMYDSKYEPWSHYVSGTRGVEPPIDPLRFLLDNAHERGIEVYAWLNPYRYIDSSVRSGWGADGGDKNYENSHPEWLLERSSTSEGTYTILNPALPEVKQRIVDVIADLLSKYDVDGVVFDDYFYQNGLEMSDEYDGQQYNDYVAAGGTLSWGDWRRENINDMVRMVNAYIKENKPWVRFGIGPAGVAASDGAVADKYGVDPCPGSDWQYDGIFSDPLAWYAEGTIDFMSPQVYWKIGNPAANYAAITPWWYEVAKKFNRHCYISQDISANFSKKPDEDRDLDEFVDEVEINRSSDLVGGTSGVVYFPSKSLRSGKTVDGKRLKFLTYMRYNVFQNKSLTPIVTWIKTECPGTVTDVSRIGRTITWSGLDNVRYSIYGVPKNEIGSFHKEEQYLLGVSYSEKFDIPTFDSNYPEQGIADSDLDNYSYAVCVLDRYGNEYSAVFEGAEVKQADKPEIVYPAAGEEAVPLFNFQWSGTAEVYEINISDDPEMDNILVRKEVTGNYVASSELWDFEADKTYYWTLTSRGHNTLETVSDVMPFTVNVFRILSPSNGQKDCPDTPTIEWTETDGSGYHLEISKNNLFTDVVYSVNTENNFATVPEFVLSGGTPYFVRVSSAIGETDIMSEISRFVVAVMVPEIPIFVTPSKSGTTLYSNWSIEVAKERAVNTCQIVISDDTSFSMRSSYVGTFDNFEFVTPVLSDVEVDFSPLVDGATYYARARFTYLDDMAIPQETEWSEPVSFVYSAEAGVGNVNADAIVLIGGDAPTVVAHEQGAGVVVYGMDGKLLMSTATDASGRASLTGLESGVYMVVVRTTSEVKTFKLVK